jgi:hypothetical protein
MATVKDTLDEARKFSPGIADWIDAARKAGMSDPAILKLLRLTTSLVIADRDAREPKP